MRVWEWGRGRTEKKLIVFEYTQVDYLIDLYDQLAEEEDLGKDHELITKLSNEIQLVWRNDLKIDIPCFPEIPVINKNEGIIAT